MSMSQTFQAILRLIERGEIRISAHGYDELAADGLRVHEILATVTDAVLLEDYPDYPKGPCVLALQHDESGQPVHVVWGIPKNASAPAVLVTAYRPDPTQWTEGFTRRKP